MTESRRRLAMWHSPDGDPGAARLAGNGAVRASLPDKGQFGFLLRMCELLWPPPAVVTLDTSTGKWPYPVGFNRRRISRETSELVLVPGVGRPPLLVPAGHRAAAAAVRHYSGQRSTAPRLTAKVFSFCLATGLGGMVMQGRIRMGVPAEADTIQTYLEGVLRAEIQVGMYVGPARANRKPVLHLLTADGEAVAFVKIGVSPLTRDLVRAEHAALTRLADAGPARITVPRVLHYDVWHGLDVLVLAPVPAWRRRRPRRAPALTAAMTEIAGIDRLTAMPLAASTYLARLRERISETDPGPDSAALAAAIDAVAANSGGTVLTHGAWHGDWTPWNMANTDDGLLVWDWERFTSDVPIGFDALHYLLQTDIGPGHRKPADAAEALVQSADRILAPFGVAPAHARLTATLYLADLATRYLTDRQAEQGAHYAAPGTWLIPAIVRETMRT